jgi:uncharacterized membrane protein
MILYVLLDYLVNGVSILGMLIIVWGVLLVTRDFVLDIFSEDPKAKRLMRQKLGSFLILGLEFFIAADIIRTITRPDWNEIGMLAAIIALRTVLISPVRKAGPRERA